MQFAISRQGSMTTDGQTRGAKILVVDDVAANLDVQRRVLESAGYQVLLAFSGEVALRNARRARPDLIMLDVMMPEMNGYEVCRRPRGQGNPLAWHLRLWMGLLLSFGIATSG